MYYISVTVAAGLKTGKFEKWTASVSKFITKELSKKVLVTGGTGLRLTTRLFLSAQRHSCRYDCECK